MWRQSWLNRQIQLATSLVASLKSMGRPLVRAVIRSMPQDKRPSYMINHRPCALTWDNKEFSALNWDDGPPKNLHSTQWALPIDLKRGSNQLLITGLILAAHTSRVGAFWRSASSFISNERHPHSFHVLAMLCDPKVAPNEQVLIYQATEKGKESPAARRYKFPTYTILIT